MSGKEVNWPWFDESEIHTIVSRVANACHALTLVFGYPERDWESCRLQGDDSAIVPLFEDVCDLAAKSLILVGVQEGSGSSARMRRFAEAHREEAMHAVVHRRPLSPVAATAALQEWDRRRRFITDAAKNTVKVRFSIDWPSHAMMTLRTALMIATRPNSIKVSLLPNKTGLFVWSNIERMKKIGIDVSRESDGTVLVRDRNGDCDPVTIANLLHNIMRDHELNLPISFMWSEYCPGDPEALASCGGAFVSIHGVRIFYAIDLLESAMQAAHDEIWHLAGA